MFVVMASGKFEPHTYFTFLQGILTSTHMKKSNIFCIIRGLLEKYPTFGREKNWLTWSVGHLIILKVVPLGLHTLLPAVSPLLEACRKSLFRNGV